MDEIQNLEDKREISVNLIKEIINNTKSIKEEDRKKAENILKEFKYNKSIYQNLFDFSIINNENININIQDKMQSLLILKNILKKELLNFNLNPNMGFTQMTNSTTVNEILSILKEKVIYILKNNHLLNAQLKPLCKEIILLISLKFFPNSWDELNDFFFRFFLEEKINEKLSNNQNFDSLIFISNCFYGIIKEYAKKKTIMSRNKYYPYKQNFIDSFEKFYQNIHLFFNQNYKNFQDLNMTLNFLNLLLINDNILCKIIEISYYHAEFHKDEKLINLINFTTNKIEFILSLINNCNTNKNILEKLQKNLYKLIKNCGSLQASNPILFYKNLNSYSNILLTIIQNCDHFSEDVIKATFFTLSKVISTSIYKDINDIDDQLVNNKSKMNNNIIEAPEFSLMKTPEKKKINSNSNNNLTTSSALKIITSPAKYKNFDTEIKISKKGFNDCFSNEIVLTIIECLIAKCPFIFPNENDNEEIEILTDLEENDTIHLNSENNFSLNNYTFNSLYKSLLESFILNFTDLSLQYIKDKLSKLYQIGTNNTSYLQTDSFFNFVNILPSLYKSKIISITQMIDSNEYISYIESLIKSSNLILKRYINTLSKWSFILISNETIFKYINNLTMFISNVNNPYTLIQSCICLKNILDSIDKQMSGLSDSINTIINKDKFAVLLKNEINWGYLLCLSTSVLKSIIPLASSSELIIALVKFFTSLLQKSHYQNNGDILKVIRDSNLFQLTINSKDEFTENIYIEMYENLLFSLSDSNDIVHMCLSYNEYLIRKNISIDNVSFLYFIVKVAKYTNDIKNNLYNFIKQNYNLFLINTNSQSLSNLLVSILEEVTLFDIFENNNDLNSVYNLVYVKYENTYNIIISYISKVKNGEYNSLLSPMKKNYDLMLNDLYESKKILLSFFNTILIYYTTIKKLDVTNIYKSLLKMLFNETKSIYEVKESNFLWENSMYLLQIIERICIYNFSLFQDCLTEFLQENNNYSVENYFSNLLNLMDETIDAKIRKINIVFICKLLPLFNYNFLLNNIKHILDICLNLLHSEYTKKIYEKENNAHNNNNFNSFTYQFGDNIKMEECLKNYNYNNNTLKKKMNIKMSERKEKLIDNDELIKSDILTLFTHAIKLKCEQSNVDVKYFLNSINYSGINKVKEIFNIILH